MHTILLIVIAIAIDNSMINLRPFAVIVILIVSACSESSDNTDELNNATLSIESNVSSNSVDTNSSVQENNTGPAIQDDSTDVTDTQISSTQNNFDTDAGDTNSSNNADNTINSDNVNNDINEAVVPAELPQGCIGDVDAANNLYCVYPDTRLFISSLADGSTRWSFTLPGENNANEIEAVIVVGSEVVLVADRSPGQNATANDKYEISRFAQSGAFIETVSVSLTPESDTTVCQDAWCAYYDNSSLLPLANQADENVVAQRTITANGELGLLIGWSRYHIFDWDSASNSALAAFEGGVVSVVELDTGVTIAERLYPNDRVVGIGSAVNGLVTVTTDQQQTQLTNALISANQPDNAITGFNGDSISSWLFDWNSVISANPLRILAAEVAYIETVHGWLNGTDIDDAIDAEVLFGDNTIDLSSIDALADPADSGYSESTVEANCSNGGTVTITNQTLQPQQVIGDGAQTTTNRHYRFNQCAFNIDEQLSDGSQLESLDIGSYLLNGDFLNLSEISNDRNGSNTLSTLQANAVQLIYPNGTVMEITGLNSNNSQIDARNFSRFLSLENTISHYSITKNGIETARWRDFSRNATLNTSNVLYSWNADIHGDVFDINIGNQELNIQTSEPFSRTNNQVISNKPFDSFNGEIIIATDNGDRILLQPVSDGGLPFTREWILVTSERNGSSNGITIPLQSLYSPVSVEESQ